MNQRLREDLRRIPQTDTLSKPLGDSDERLRNVALAEQPVILSDVSELEKE